MTSFNLKETVAERVKNIIGTQKSQNMAILNWLNTKIVVKSVKKEELKKEVRLPNTDVKEFIFIHKHEMTFEKHPLHHGQPVCWKCLHYLFGVSNRTLKYRKSGYLKGARTWDHFGKGSKKVHQHPKAMDCHHYILEYSERFGCNTPDNKGVELPPGSKALVYADYRLECEFRADGRHPAKISTFRYVWRKDFSHVHIPHNARWVNSLFCYQRQLS